MPVKVKSDGIPTLETVKEKVPRGRATEAAKAKMRVLRFIQEGHTVKEACAMVGRSVPTYHFWMKSDPEFKENVQHLRGMQSKHREKTEVPDFPDFCEKYLGVRLFRHQLQWFDLLEGREPRDIHPGQVYEKGESSHVIVNTPPEHGKSTTITVYYSIWRICKDPNVRIVIVSKTQSMAKKFLHQIKTILTHPRFRDLQLDFAPGGGWEQTADVWAAEMIYIGGEERDSAEKDPTVQVLGIGSQIYGARADVIIIDDAVILANAHEFEKQIDWIQQEVMTRPGHNGVVLVVGTRVRPIDLYVELKNPKRYPDGENPWTYLSQPAVLAYADDPQDWVTLWPRSNIPEAGEKEDADGEGLFPKWTGARLAKRRRMLKPETWAMVYMQEQIQESAIFPSEDVQGCINPHRLPGRMTGGQVNVPEHGQAGMYVIAGLDPAMVNYTAATVIAVDRMTAKRYVLNVHNQAAMTPNQMRDLIKEWTTTYSVNEWVIEGNAFQKFMTQDQEINTWLAARGVVLREHQTTGKNKWDADFGVASMATLFRGWREGFQLIQLPRPHNLGVQSFIEQLITWFPETKAATDCVMSFWFCEIRARELVAFSHSSLFVDNPFLSANDLASRFIVDAYDLDQMAEEDAASTSPWAAA